MAALPAATTFDFQPTVSHGIPSLFWRRPRFFQQSRHRFAQRRHVGLNDLPDAIMINDILAVNQHIAETDDRPAFGDALRSRGIDFADPG